MEWIYGGVLTAWYVVFSVIFMLALPSHTEPWMLALACFVLIPSLFVGIIGVGEDFIPTSTKAVLRRGFQRGSLTGRYAFIVGLVVGVVSIAGVVAITCAGYPWRTSGVVVVSVLFGGAMVVFVSPFLGLWWLKRQCAADELNAR
jgi:hypothetical protein